MYEITLFRHVTPCSLVDRNNDTHSCNTLKCNQKTRVTSHRHFRRSLAGTYATQQVPAAASTACTFQRHSQFAQCGTPAAAAVSNRNMGGQTDGDHDVKAVTPLSRSDFPEWY